MSRFDRLLASVIRDSAAEIGRLFREHASLELARYSSHIKARRARKRQVILCPVKGCGKPGGGPKWGWFCRAHKELPAAAKDKARAETRARPKLSTPSRRPAKQRSR
jgi:hypothetical protein